MAPDVDELIKRVNTLTLDKNRLRQKLVEFASPSNKDLNNQQIYNNSNHAENLIDFGVCAGPANASSKNSPPSSNNKSVGEKSNLISGVECSTSCLEDLLYTNELYRKRLDEYNSNWDFIQSKCTALLSEMSALQAHFAILKREKMELEEKFRSKCDDYEAIKSEHQTVVLNYETQLSAMSEHLSMITSSTNLGDNLARLQH